MPEIIGNAASYVMATPFFMCFVGAFTLLMITRTNEKERFSIFGSINIDVSLEARPRIVLCDLICSSLLGAFIVLVLAGPETPAQSVAAGLGMSGLLSSLKKGEQV